MCSGYERYRKKLFLLLLIFTSTKINSVVIHNRHKMWRENVAFDYKSITKESLKLLLNLSPFKLYTISPKKRQFILADTYSPWKDTFKLSSWKAIWYWVRVWKHLAWIFHLVDLFLSLVLIIIQFLFFIFMYFMWFSSK